MLASVGVVVDYGGDAGMEGGGGHVRRERYGVVVDEGHGVGGGEEGGREERDDAKSSKKHTPSQSIKLSSVKHLVTSGFSLNSSLL